MTNPKKYPKKYEVHEYPDGSKEWYLNGKKLTKEEFEYHLNGELHRENGPAIEYPDGSKKWYLNGELHREDGPAIEYSDGYKEWYLNGKKLTKDKL